MPKVIRKYTAVETLRRHVEELSRSHPHARLTADYDSDPPTLTIEGDLSARPAPPAHPIHGELARQFLATGQNDLARAYGAEVADEVRDDRPTAPPPPPIQRQSPIDRELENYWRADGNDKLADLLADPRIAAARKGSR